MGTAYAAAVGNPPDPRTLPWLAWAESLVDFRRKECPAARGTTYYFSQAGDDTTGDGSEASPWKTLAKAHAIIDASSGDVACLFKRGDVWVEVPAVVFGQNAANSTGAAAVLSTKPNVTIGAYGLGDRPRFDHPHQTYTTGWALDTGTTYVRSEPTEIAWLARVDRNDPLRHVSSAADCRLTSSSWFWDSANEDLYVNLGGTDPSTVTLSGVHANNHSCFRVTGDGSRVASLDGWGWGINPQDTNSHHYFINLAPTGTDAVYVYNCRASYGSAHVLASWNQGSGGIVTFEECEANWPSYLSVTQNFNLYSAGGNNENILWNCRARYGALPDGAGTYTIPTTSAAFNGHTGPLDTSYLQLAWGLFCDGSAYPVGWPGEWGNPLAASGDLTACRAWMVGMVTEKVAGAGNGYRLAPNLADCAQFNCRATLRPSNLSIEALTNLDQDGWAWNNIYDIDLIDVGARRFGGFNGSVTNGSAAAKFWLNTIIVRNRATGSGSVNHTWGIDADCFAGGNQTGNSMSFRGNLYAGENTNNRVHLGLGINSTFSHNAYFGITAASGGRLNPASDTNGVTLLTLPNPNLSPDLESPLYLAGPSDLGIEYDADWSPRTAASPSIGALEYRPLSDTLTAAMSGGLASDITRSQSTPQLR